MAELTLEVARKILDAALAKGTEKNLKPLVVTILDARGCTKLTAAQDGTSLMRAEIAHGKAYGALAMGMGSRALFQRAQEQPYFVGAVNTLAQGRLVPVPGGVLIQRMAPCSVPSASAATPRTMTKPAPSPASRPPD